MKRHHLFAAALAILALIQPCFAANRSQTLKIIGCASYTLEEKPGNTASVDMASLTCKAGMGNSNDRGYGFAGIHAGVPDEIVIHSTVSSARSIDENSFAGLIVDYHTLDGFKKRVYFGLGLLSKEMETQYPFWSAQDEKECLFIDLEKEAGPSSSSGLKISLAQYAPEGWDGEAWLGAGLMNAGKTATLQIKIAAANAGETADNKAGQPWTLKNQHVRFEVTKDNGNIQGGWNQKSGERFLDPSFDEYSMEPVQPGAPTRNSHEMGDSVVEVLNETPGNRLSPRRLTLKCKNDTLNLEIVKTYELSQDARHLVKRTAFFSSAAEVTGLFKYLSTLNITDAFHKGGYYHRTGHYAWTEGLPLVPADEITSPRLLGGKGKESLACFVNLQKGFGVGHYKYTVNGKYDLTTSLVPSSYSARGWGLGITGEFLGASRSLSTEVHYMLFEGDHAAFYREYMKQPAYVQAISYETPAWLADVRFILGWGGVHSVGKQIPTDELLQLFDDDEPIFGWPISPWTDFMWEVRGDYLDGEVELYPAAKGELACLKRVQAACPRIRIGNYTWHHSLGIKSKTYTQHPDWAVFDRDGKPLQLKDMTMICTRPNILLPEYQDHVFTRVRRLMEKLKYDIYYTDEIGSVHCAADWKTKRVIQNYDWIAYWDKLRSVVREFGSDKVYFSNSLFPQTTGFDCGFAEYGTIQWMDLADQKGSKSWRANADHAFMTKLFQPRNRWIALIFWGHAVIKSVRNNDPYCSNYLIGLGLKPSHPDEADLAEMGGFWTSTKSKMPYINAAYETRGAMLAEAHVQPCWWKEKTEIEAYSLTQGNAALIPVISHEKKPSTAAISADLDSLGLSPGRETYGWQFDMRDPWSIKKDEVLQPAWLDTVIMKPNLFLMQKLPPGKRISATIECRPELLSMVMFTQTPAFIASINGRKAQLLLPTTMDASIEGQLYRPSKTSKLNIRTKKKEIEIMALYPAKWGRPRARLDGQPLEFTEENLFGQRFIRCKIPQGNHLLTLEPK
ncbi:MAG: hypothetical protein PHV34_15870 [Verrucomicrobiae bacterium]|nr:hypothetical protein [Verrucomicrobiae bacterium]